MSASLAILDPSFRCKVRALRTVESMIESSMIAIWKCDHDLAGLLCDFVEWNIVLLEHLWTNERHFVSEKCRTFGILLTERQVGELLKLLCICRCDGVPSLWRS